MEKLKRFFKEAFNHEEIRKELLGHKDVESLVHQIVESGKKLGYDFTVEEVRLALTSKKEKELGDNDLTMSGGGGNPLSAAFHAMNGSTAWLADAVGLKSCK